MTVRVYRVIVAARSTVGLCEGAVLDDDGRELDDQISFGADHRAARELGAAIEAADDISELPVVEIEDWQVLGVEEVRA
ncbi:MAG TPA: hypothetical protein VFD84_09000 [Candidatus Binatia bacterium]|nr:hypothetical protein [Candidatus Binatia bacterium]